MKNDRRTILLVEDNEDDVFIMQRALKEAEVTNPLFVVDDGQKAVDYLNGDGNYGDRARFPLPSIIFLDLKLPLKSGHEVLAWMRERTQFNRIVVVVLTSSEEPVDVKESYRLGANSYLVKPPTSHQLLDLAKAFKWYWLKLNQYAEV